MAGTSFDLYGRAAALLLLFAVVATAEEPVPALPWATKALEVERALGAGDEGAARDGLGGDAAWLAVDHLVATGKLDVARRAAGLIEGANWARLPEYVDRIARQPADAGVREALARAVRATLAEDHAAALAACDGVELTAKDVPTVWALFIRHQLRGAAGRPDEALADAEAGARIAEEIGWLSAGRDLSGSAGQAALGFGADERAASAFETCARLAAQTGRRETYVYAVVNVGVCFTESDPERAIPWLEKGIAATDELPETGAAQLLDYRFNALSLLGQAHHHRMDFPSAIAAYERSVALEPRLAGRRRVDVALMLRSLGQIRLGLGLHQEAYDAYAASEQMWTKAKRPGQAQISRGGCGAALISLGRSAEAVEVLEEVVAFLRKMNAPALVTIDNLGTLALAYEGADRIDDADAAFKEALALAESAGSAERAGWVRLNQARLLISRKRHADALAPLEAAAQWARENASPYRERHAQTLLAVAHAGAKQWAEGIVAARSAVDLGEAFTRGLGDAEASKARGDFQDAFAAGTYCALRADDPDAACWFVESGRAMAFLEMLGARHAELVAEIPAALREEVETARRAVITARRTYEARRQRRRMKELRAAKAALEEAEAAWAAAKTRVERASKRGAALAYPDPASVPEIAGVLQPGEALVLYAARLEGLGALVIEHGSAARLVDLGERAEVMELAARVAAASADFAAVAGAEDLAALRARLVAPLALGEATRTVLLSPYAELCYVPFARLVPDRDIANVPSGTVLVRMRGETAAPGRGVLALGDPDYDARPLLAAGEAATRGPGLVRLPATAEEVRAIAGGADDVRLLRGDATEARFRAALPGRPRWSALHFACHGLLDLKRPTLSSLALTPTKEDDGHLTALEISSMDLPADLVVLSACETGRGEVHASEGIVGLTRSFMLAGAPRVLCSLWNVDDAATSALMKRFYELRAEGRGTAAALRGAQEWVRSQAAWAHPAYWAAWVLWGRPE